MAEYDRYQERYGAWAGNRRGMPPDYARCCAPVWSRDGGWSREAQCARNRGFGPDKAYCKQHDPAKVEQRRAEATRKANESWNKQRYDFHGRAFFTVLEQIAAGHNDARGLAQEDIAKFKAGERPSPGAADE